MYTVYTSKWELTNFFGWAGITLMWDWFHLVWVVCQSEGERNDSKLYALPSVGPTWLHTLSLGAAFLFLPGPPNFFISLQLMQLPCTVHGHTSWTLTTTPDTFSSCINVCEIKAMQSASLFPGPSQLSVACSIFVHESLGTRLAKWMNVDLLLCVMLVLPQFYYHLIHFMACVVIRQPIWTCV